MLCSESHERVNAGDRTMKGERRTHSTTATTASGNETSPASTTASDDRGKTGGRRRVPTVLFPSSADTADPVFCAPFSWRVGAHRGVRSASDWLRDAGAYGGTDCCAVDARFG